MKLQLAPESNINVKFFLPILPRKPTKLLSDTCAFMSECTKLPKISFLAGEVAHACC